MNCKLNSLCSQQTSWQHIPSNCVSNSREDPVQLAQWCSTIIQSSWNPDNKINFAYLTQISDLPPSRNKCRLHRSSKNSFNLLFYQININSFKQFPTVLLTKPEGKNCTFMSATKPFFLFMYNCSPVQGDLNWCSQTRCEYICRQVRLHWQKFMRLAGRYLNTISE